MGIYWGFLSILKDSWGFLGFPEDFWRIADDSADSWGFRGFSWILLEFLGILEDSPGFFEQYTRFSALSIRSLILETEILKVSGKSGIL